MIRGLLLRCLRVFDSFICENFSERTVSTISILFTTGYVFLQLNKEDCYLTDSFGISWTLVALEVFIWMVSIFNTIFTVIKIRKYQLLFADKKTIEDDTTGFLRVESLDKNNENVSILDLLKANTEKEGIIVLYLWSPDRNNLAIFCMFSPILLSFLYNMKKESFICSLISGFLLSICLRLGVYLYETKIKGLQVLHGEVLNEYQKKYVNPRTKRMQALGEILERKKKTKKKTT